MNCIASQNARIIPLLVLIVFQQGCGSKDLEPVSEKRSAEKPGHAHAHGDQETSIRLSDAALKNVGYQPFAVKLTPYTKKNSVPTIVVERAGRSQLDVTAPMTGIVTRVYRIEGEAVDPGQPLFDLRLTHEDLVASQRDFLRSLEELDILDREIARLKSVSEGIIAGRNILDREYARQKINAAILSLRESLLLHGLSGAQVDEIRKTRKLFKELTVYAPEMNADCSAVGKPHPFTIQSLRVKPGQQLAAGGSLCVLSDHRRLYLQGKAFEADAPQLIKATEENQPINVVRLSEGDDFDSEEQLRILYLSDSVDPDSRAFHFYMELPNTITQDRKREETRFIDWKYKPGQRFEVRLPIGKVSKRLVLPIDAVVREGAEAYVFRQNGKQFDRVPVHVEYQGPQQIVIANDGAIFPGDVVAAQGAYQMYLAIKNKATGGVDPHAGHTH